MNRYIAKRDVKAHILVLIISVVLVPMFLFAGEIGFIIKFIFCGLWLIADWVCLKTLINRTPVAIIDRDYIEVFEQLSKKSVKYRWEDIERFDRCLNVERRNNNKKRKEDDLYIILKGQEVNFSATGQICIDLNTLTNKRTFLSKIAQTEVPVRRVSRLEMAKEQVANFKNFNGLR